MPCTFLSRHLKIGSTASNQSPSSSHLLPVASEFESLPTSRYSVRITRCVHRNAPAVSVNHRPSPEHRGIYLLHHRAYSVIYPTWRVLLSRPTSLFEVLQQFAPLHHAWSDSAIGLQCLDRVRLDFCRVNIDHTTR